VASAQNGAWRSKLLLSSLKTCVGAASAVCAKPVQKFHTCRIAAICVWRATGKVTPLLLLQVVAARNQCLSGRLPIEHATIDDLESTEANPEKEATTDQAKMSGRFLILLGYRIRGQKARLLAACEFAVEGDKTSGGFANCVADVAHRMNQRRIANLLSQSSDENFHQLRVIFVLVLPDAFAQFGAGEDASRLPHKHL